jgi:hypothetical protein
MWVKDHLLRRTNYAPVVIVLFLALAGVSTAQVSIKERVGIRPSSSTPPGVTSIAMSLEPISFSFGECGSLEEGLDNRYNDRIFIPRDGGIIGISFDSRYGRAMDGWAGACPETLLVFNQAGALIGLYSFKPGVYEKIVVGRDTIEQPRIQNYLPVRQWEALRFRLLVHCCDCVHPQVPVVLPPNVDTDYLCFSTVRTDFPILYTPNIEDKSDGQLVFRTGVQEGWISGDTCYFSYDFASRFPMEYIEYDPNANDPMPPVESNFPIEVSVTGPYRLTITWANSEVEDFLRLVQPQDTLLFPNVAAQVGETISLGTLTAGTLVQFTNSRGFVCRMPLGGPRWALTFESGTDLRFDDFQAQFEFDAGYPDHLEVRAESDTVWYGDAVAVTIMPADDQGRLSPLADDSLFQYSIELLAESQPYATLRYNGVTSPLVEHIPSTGAVGRGVQLILSGAEPESTVTLQFHLKVFYLGEILPASVRTSIASNHNFIGKVLANKEGLERKGTSPRGTSSSVPRHTLSNGGGDVVMENDWSLVEKNDNKLRILDHSPWTIWPWLPAAQRVGISSYDPKRGFIIEVVRGFDQQPVKDESVVIKTEFVPMSGGHDHNDPPLPLTQLGTFYGQENSGNPLVLKTDASGRAVVDSLVASQIAGRYIVTALLVAASTMGDTVTLTVGVPQLFELTPGLHYHLVGAPQNYAETDDPCRPMPPISQHSRNHFGTATLITAVQTISAIYDSLHPGVDLRINDMSLVYGGGFDIGNSWERDIIDQYPTDPKRCNDVGHCSHRQGRNADIGHQALNQQGRCVDVVLWDLRKIIREVTKRLPYKERDCDHITVGE